MSRLFYDIFIFFYSGTIWLAAFFSEKARKWVSGRKNLPFTGKPAPSIWMHCSSLGEFEQGRPLLEALRQHYPNYRIIVSFFSPSGYEIRKNYPGADLVCYLPIDRPAHARKILDDWNPKLVIWVKYEYWFHFLNEIHKRKIPLLLVSAIFRSKQPFFKPWGALWRNMLGFFSHIFVQNESSFALLKNMVQDYRLSVSGDTRYDRVVQLIKNPSELANIASFVGQQLCLVAGSTWPDDEKMLATVMRETPYLKLIIAPHNISPNLLSQIKKLFPEAIFHSQLNVLQENDIAAAKVLIIDNIGMLSKLYAYGQIAYIGGGFNPSGIHNTLEAAVYGKPIIFGPIYHKFDEAQLLLDCGAAFHYKHAEELLFILKELCNNELKRNDSGEQAAKLVHEKAGATNKIMDYIDGNRLLTS